MFKTSDQSDQLDIDQIDIGRRQLDVSATQRFFGEAFRPLEYLEQPGAAAEFEYLDQFAPWSFEDLQSIERAAEKRKREDEISFRAEFGTPGVSVDKMATANDVDMKADLPGEPSSKSQRVGDEVAPVDAAEAAKR